MSRTPAGTRTRGTQDDGTQLWTTTGANGAHGEACSKRQKIHRGSPKTIIQGGIYAGRCIQMPKVRLNRHGDKPVVYSNVDILGFHRSLHDVHILRFSIHKINTVTHPLSITFLFRDELIVWYRQRTLYLRFIQCCSQDKDPRRRNLLPILDILVIVISGTLQEIGVPFHRSPPSAYDSEHRNYPRSTTDRCVSSFVQYIFVVTSDNILLDDTLSISRSYHSKTNLDLINQRSLHELLLSESPGRLVDRQKKGTNVSPSFAT